jgi:hypothetical protein
MPRTERAERRRRRRHFFRRVRNAVIGAVGPPLVRLWIGTLRVRYVGVEERDGKVPRGPPGIFLFWHQRILAFAGLFHHRGFKAVVSQHGDGEMIARICEGLGIVPIRGSSTRGGARAIREILRTEGGTETRLAITPDGPRGPRHVLQEGAVYLASRTGLALYPAAVSFAHAFEARTWDGFLIPLPFTRTVLRLGSRIDVPPDLGREGIEDARRRVEAQLKALTDSTDAEFEAQYRAARSVGELVEVGPDGNP